MNLSDEKRVTQPECLFSIWKLNFNYFEEGNVGYNNILRFFLLLNESLTDIRSEPFIKLIENDVELMDIYNDFTEDIGDYHNKFSESLVDIKELSNLEIGELNKYLYILKTYIRTFSLFVDKINTVNDDVGELVKNVNPTIALKHIETVKYVYTLLPYSIMFRDLINYFQRIYSQFTYYHY